MRIQQTWSKWISKDFNESLGGWATHLKNMLGKLDHVPNVWGVTIKKNIWNHHLGMYWPLPKHWFTVDFMKVCLGSLHTNEFRLFSHCELGFWQAPMYVGYPQLSNLHCKQIFLPLDGLLVDQSSKTTTCWMRYHEILLGQVLELLDSPIQTQLGVAEQLHPLLFKQLQSGSTTEPHL